VSFLIASAVDIVLLLTANAISGEIIVEIPGRTQPVGVGEVLFITLFAALAAAIGTALVVRWSWGLRFVMIAGAVITLLSLTGAFAATTTTGVIALTLMHLATGFTVVTINVILQRRRVRETQPTR
jgi:hypothetical protein